MTEVVSYVELDVPHCSLIYGEGTIALWGDRSVNISLSESNRRATLNSVSGGAFNSIRSDSLKLTGKWHFEIEIVVSGGINLEGFGVGIANQNAALGPTATEWFGHDNNSIAMFGNNGSIWINGSDTGFNGPSFVAGDTIVVEVDLNAALIWFAKNASGDWNNSGTADPATGAGGIDITAVLDGATGIFAGVTMHDVNDSARIVGTYVRGVSSGFTSFGPGCHAELGVTGDRKCFNSLGTCQDRNSYTDEPKTYRFGEDVSLRRDIDCFPFIKNIDVNPTIVSLGQDIGQRATIKSVFRDARHSDTGDVFDKYPETRDYDPYTQGTFWGKFRARNPYLRGRSLRLLRSMDEQALSEMETRHYLIDSYDGPDADGTFSVVAKDVLKFADGDRAQAPIISNGFIGVDTGTNSPAVLTLSPTGVGREYPLVGYATVGGNEIISFTRTSGSDVLSITGRGQLGTLAATHSIGDRVQLVLRYESKDPADIIYDLLVNYADVDPSFINLATWQAETAAFLARVYTFTIGEPTDVDDLISEILLQMGGAIWWDDLEQLIKLRVLRAIGTDVDRYNEDNVLAGTLEVRDQPEKRVSQVWVYFGQINPLTKLDETDNWRSTERVIDEEAELNEGTPAIKKIFARGVVTGGRTVATRMGELHLSRYVKAPRRFNFELLRASVERPLLGQGYRLGGGAPRITSWPFQDDTGASQDIPIQITRINPEVDKFDVEAEEMLFTAYGGDVDPTDRTIIFDVNENNVNLKTRHDQLFPAPESGDNVTAIVAAGTIIGSNTISDPAFNIGDWPAGVSIALIVVGRIQGKGGNGGNGQNFNGSASTPGEAGGTALFTRQSIDLTSTEGEIWGGGGGGGGSNTSLIGGTTIGGSGGGGGAGMNVGQGGAAGVGSNPPSTNGVAGSNGTNDAGGARGSAGINAGGNGGNPGMAGDNSLTTGKSGGAAGVAIDGDSFTTDIGAAGDIRGPQIN